MANIEFDSETLGNILRTRKNLRVPTNQRSYAWKKEHVDDLFKDLNAAITAVLTASVATASLARYYLRRLQMEADGTVELHDTPNDGKAVTLEHVLPQKPGTEWSHIPVDAAIANYNRLGNQALLAGFVNSKIGNVGFEQKKPDLAGSPFSLTSSIAKRREWNVKEIAGRQGKLATPALKAWPLLIK